RGGDPGSKDLQDRLMRDRLRRERLHNSHCEHGWSAAKVGGYAMSTQFRLWVAFTVAIVAAPALPAGQEKKADQQATPITQPKTIKLADIRMRDVCILPDQASKIYYMVGPAGPG